MLAEPKAVSMRPQVPLKATSPCSEKCAHSCFMMSCGHDSWTSVDAVRFLGISAMARYSLCEQIDEGGSTEQRSEQAYGQFVGESRHARQPVRHDHQERASQH